MLFNSFTFLVFFAVVYCVYWRLSHRAQNLFLLFASLVFYGSWNYRLIPLIVISATIDFVCGLIIARHDSVRTRRCALIVSIATNLALLGFFKYCNFFVHNFVQLLSALGFSPSIHTLNIILPVGISFYTFQSMSYTIDIYRGVITPTRRYADFLLYVSFFPQLVAGPIERADRLLPQLLKPRRRLSTGRFVDGIKLIIIGYFQKVAIADTVAPIADAALTRSMALDSFAQLTGIYAFAIQIYCDFSGYSKIARGTARLLGVNLMKNFDQPYFSRNCKEFWSRWHISLSTWLRDYLYIPLGGNRHGNWRTYLNLMMTMLLGGLWHGASWNFVCWGAIHGLFLVWCRAFPAPANVGLTETRPRKWARIFLTFHLVAYAWTFFRIEVPAKAFDVTLLHFSMEIPLRLPGLELVYIAVYGLITFGLDWFLERSSQRGSRYLICLFSRHWWIETLAFTSLILFTLLVGGSYHEPFIYFQF